MPQESGTSLPDRVLIAGVSTRAAAESAARAGFAVTAIDAFGDLDQHPSVRGISLTRDLGVPVSARSAAHAARTIECDAVAYLSSFDNHPGAVATLAAGRRLWGNAPAVLRRVRDPMLVARALRQRGSAAPDVYALPSSGPAVVDSRPPSGDDRRWLVKPLASGGGHRVRPWREAMRLPRGCYLQELVDGTPGSVAFVAAGGRAVPLGVSRQLIGEDAFGASGYRYCGSILAAADELFARDEALVHAACALARAVAAEFDLVGVNGVDFIECRGVPYAIEVNPRWSASMELVEQAHDLSVFGAHAAACGTGALPEFDFTSARSSAGAVGKAVVFARRDVAVGDTRAWLEDRSVRDVPHPGERIRAGRPVCTVFAADRDDASCHAALVGRAERVYEQLAAWELSIRAC
jgi:predicted ATP-grasp superfamily ATP-dependent carboligase